MRTCTAILFVFVLALASAPAGQKGKPPEHSANEIKIFELTNQERKKKEIAPLKLNPALSRIARVHSDNMARQGKMEHKLDDKGPDARVKDAGYKFVALAENLAAGEDGATMENIMKAWMESKGHAVNILDSDYTEIGVGIARDKAGQLYLTQVFATPARE